jgi:alpha-galactosidase
MAQARAPSLPAVKRRNELQYPGSDFFPPTAAGAHENPQRKTLAPATGRM